MRTASGVLMYGVLAAACLSGLVTTTAHAAASGNLIVGGDGEAATCTTDWYAKTTVPGWTVTQGGPSVVCYSIASFNKPSSGSGGNAFIANGPYGDSALRQNVDVSSAASAIDGGGVTFNLSGWLGGYTIYGGQAVVTATFLSAAGLPLGTAAQLSGGTAYARSYGTGFVAKSTTGSVPSGTRKIEVLLSFVGTTATTNDGYADNLSLTLSTPVTQPTLQPPASSVPAFDHVYVLMLENTTYNKIIGDTVDAPYINGLANQGTLLDTYSGEYHPSDQNYLAISGGNTFVQGATYFPDISVNVPAPSNNADELEAAGKTWKVYEQGMGTPCNTTQTYDKDYDADDAPYINYVDISGNIVRCAAHLFDTTQLTTDEQSIATMPAYAWIAADDYNNGELSGDGIPLSLQTQDAFVQQTLVPLFNSPSWTQQRSLLILTWDESTTLPPPLEETQNNHIATIVLGSPGTVQSGYVSNVAYDHYSAARTVEAATGIGPLTNNDKYAQPFNDAFVASPPLTAATLSGTTPAATPGTFVHYNYATPAATMNDNNWVGIYALSVVPCTAGVAVATQTAPNGSGTVTFDTTLLPPAGLLGINYNIWYCNGSSSSALAGPIAFKLTGGL